MLSIDTEQGLHYVLADDVPLREALVDGPGGLRLLPGNSDIAALSRADPAKLPQVFDVLADAADYVLVDTSAGLIVIVATLSRREVTIRGLQPANHPFT